MENKFNLEEFVKNNEELFNSEEPPEGHFERFQAKLDRKSGKSRSFLYKSMKYAAVILVLISGFLILDQTNIFKNNDVIVENFNEDEEFTEVASFYNSQIDQKFEELNNITCKQADGQKEVVNNDMLELNKSFEDLKDELNNNPNNPMIRNAMISNYQMRIDVLDMVIKTLKNYC